MKNIDRIRMQAERDIRRRMKLAALFMEGEIKQSIAGHKGEHPSVKTGRFKNSIVGFERNGNGYVVDGVPYGKFLEFGTTRIMPRRHFRNSLNRNKHQLFEIIGKRLI